MGKFVETTHLLFPHRCLDAWPKWEDHSLYCPECQRLIAYIYELHGQYHIHIAHPFNTKETYENRIKQSIPSWFFAPPPKEDYGMIHWELLSEPIEPLISDTWDDDEAYEKCIKEYINRNKAENKIDL